MTWTGKRRWTASAFTYVPLGAVMVPTAIEFEFLGDVGEPDMSARFEMRAGRPECVELTIRARPQGRDIRTSDLEGVVDVGIDRMVETAFARLAVEPDADGNWTWTGNERDVDGNLTPKPPWHAETDADLFWLAAGELSERRKARRPVALEELELVARIYREHIDGQPVVEV